MEYGTLIVQVNTEDTFATVMNDYDDENGEFKKSFYVQTTRHLVENGFYYTCTCKIYRTLLECLGGDDPYDAIDIDGVKCMHCRFLKEDLFPNIVEEKNATISVLQAKVQQALLYADKPIVELPSSFATTKKFSVLTEDDQISFVHLTFNSRTNRYVISCLNGYCKSHKGCKRNINSLQSEKNLCAHLKELQKNPHYWSDLLTAGSSSDTTENDIDYLNGSEVDNGLIEQDDEYIAPEPNNTSNFNVDDGMWGFPCESTHAPLKQRDPVLAKNIQTRNNSWICLDFSSLENGCVKGPDLVQDIPEHTCRCGAGWNDAANPSGKKVFDRTLTVYTLIAPVYCPIFTRICLKENEPCRLKWDEGQSLSMHVVTKETAAGDEIGWNYVNHVMDSSVTFSSFCKLMTSTYQMYNPNFRKFMDPAVFRKWWFSWAASMKIDFRKPCPVCKYTPKQLACDGTKVGVGFRHAAFDEINKPDDPNTALPTLHRRMTRCFLSDKLTDNRDHLKMARDHLNYVSLSFLKEILLQNVLSDEVIQNRNTILMSVLPEDVRPSFKRFLEDMPEVEKIAYAAVGKMLSTTAPIASLIPCSFCDSLTQLLDHLSGKKTNNGENLFFNNKMKEMREYAPEIRDLIGTSMQCNVSEAGHPYLPNDIVLLLYYLVKRVKDMETTPQDTAAPQFETYNPPKYGRAYYFSETGQRLRPVRNFEIDLEKKNNAVYDDRPMEHDICEKYFSKTHIAARGTSTLFLWFCPNHGHCYGFHMTNAEGRKDPSASLYSYLETPPKDIFYDFACNLHEYCLNRESGFYKDVRFFHDIFHGFAHKCSCAYRSSRLLGFESINSEICEQFNSFIQCIKGSARQMTQEHFCFYLQFFLHQWNENKRNKFEKRMTVALAGL